MLEPGEVSALIPTAHLPLLTEDDQRQDPESLGAFIASGFGWMVPPPAPEEPDQK